MPRLKSWESPRRQGRNEKGKGGSARKRQLKKQQQMLRKKLKGNGEGKTTLFPFSMNNYHLSMINFFSLFMNISVKYLVRKKVVNI